MDVSSTSEFKKSIIEKLNVVFEGTGELLSVETKVSCDDLYIQEIENEEIRKYKNNNNLNIDEKTICQYINEIVINENLVLGTSESHTDNFVDFILRKLKLDRYPLRLSLQPIYKFNIGNHWITSKPEFSITKDDLVLFIDEDKHIKNINRSQAWGEYQIAGEMIAAAVTNYNKIDIEHKRKNKEMQIVYSMRVIGTRFTFYKAIISHSYLDSLSEGYPDNNFVIYRYPNQENGPFSNFNYLNPSERRIIVNTLCQLSTEFHTTGVAVEETAK